MSQDFPFEHFLSAPQATEKEKTALNSNSYKQNSLPVFDAPPSEKSSENNLFSAEEIALIQSDLLTQIRAEIPAVKYNTLFDGALQVSDIKEKKVFFSASTATLSRLLESSYKGLLEMAVQRTLGASWQADLSNNSDLGLGTQVAGSLYPEQNQGLKPRTARDAKFTIEANPTNDDLIHEVESKYIDHVRPTQQGGIQIDHTKTFDNFIVGPSNNMAFSTAIAVANKPGKGGKYPSLYIHSNSGLGKTHLLHAIANRIREEFPELIICFTSAKIFMTELVSAIQSSKTNEFRRKYIEQVDVLMIDDIHELSHKEQTQNEFFHVFNELHNKGKQLIFTSDKTPKEIDGIEERLKTRLQWGLVTDIQRPDLETRIAILKKKAIEIDLFLSDEIITTIAQAIKTNIRELEGNLVKLKAYADLINNELDTEHVKQILNLDSFEEERNEVTIESITKATAKFYNIALADLRSKSRGKDVANARFVAMFLCRKMIKAKQQDIGRFFGGRDHSSVIHAIRTITERLKSEPALTQEIFQIESELC